MNAGQASFRPLVVGIALAAGYVQGEFETAPEAVAWLRSAVGHALHT